MRLEELRESRAGVLAAESSCDRRILMYALYH